MLPWQDTVLRPSPWIPLLVGARWWVRYGPGLAIKQRLLREWLDVGLRQRPHMARAVRTRQGLRFQVPSTLDFIARTIYLNGVWEPNITALLTNRLAPGEVVIDIGAAGGWHTTLASRLVGETGSVIAIEPAPAQLQQLRANLALNDCRNVRIVEAAVTEEPTQVRLFVPDPGNAGATTTIQPASYTSEISAVGLPLAQIVDDDIDRARIIKIDVEGAEATVLTALVPLIPRLRPDCEILVEVTPRWLHQTGHTAEELLTPFIDSGFRAFAIENGYAPQDVPAMVRTPARPVAVTTAITRQTDLLLSRVQPGPDIVDIDGADRASSTGLETDQGGDLIADALAWVRSDMLGAQKALNEDELAGGVPAHVEVVEDILADEHRWTFAWRREVAARVVAARDRAAG
ncbi:FkbM family methyltransferase [Nocardia sp. NPDC058497]|uniref:FkbM family methyltransferase n=1 Tax=Nocardia sp. NPDC058497 TaxID=3346529 RepID=UPI00364C4987